MTHGNVVQRDNDEAHIGSVSPVGGSEKWSSVRNPALHVLKPSVRWRSQAEFFQDFFYFLVGELVYAFVFVGVAA
jgi:hypothetical protein